MSALSMSYTQRKFDMSLEQARKYYKKLDEEMQALWDIPSDKATINQINREDRIGDIQSDLEIQYGLDNLKSE